MRDDALTHLWVIDREKIVGIDFGTTNSYIAYMRPSDRPNPILGRPTALLPPSPEKTSTPIMNRDGAPTVASVLGHDEKGYKIKTGFPAMDFRDKDYQDSFLIANLKDKCRQVDREIKCDISDTPTVEIEGIVARYLYDLFFAVGELRASGIPEKGITISVPAKSDGIQRLTMEFAARVAGFGEKVNLIEEPVAAFLYHKFISSDAILGERLKDGYALVIDFGGGTCDVAVLRISNNNIFVAGRAMAYLGGNLLDIEIVGKFWSGKQWSTESGANYVLNNWEDLNVFARQELLLHARYVKEKLSIGSAETTWIDSEYFPDITEPIRAPSISQDALIDFLRKHPIAVEYANCQGPSENRSTLDHVKQLIDMAMEDARLTGENIPDYRRISVVIFAGGSTHLPGYKAAIKEIFQDNVCYIDEEPEKCVAYGAVVYEWLQRSRKTLRVQQPLNTSYRLKHTLSPNHPESQTLVKKGTILPVKKKGGWRAHLIYPVPETAGAKFWIVDDVLKTVPFWE